MVTEGVEIIIGLLDDPQFGPVIMFGLGGVFTEVLKDVSFRVVPIVRRCAGDDPRGGGQCHPPGLPRPARRLRGDAGRSAAERQPHGDGPRGRLESVDFNPIVVWGDQHRVLDAKVIWRKNPNRR